MNAFEFECDVGSFLFLRLGSSNLMETLVIVCDYFLLISGMFLITILTPLNSRGIEPECFCMDVEQQLMIYMVFKTGAGSELSSISREVKQTLKS